METTRAQRPWNSVYVYPDNDPPPIPDHVVHKRVAVVYDPTGLYDPGGWFSTMEFACTAHFGYWPEGAVFTIHSHGKDQERLVQIQDGRVVDVDSNEVMHTRYGVQWCWEQGE